MHAGVERELAVRRAIDEIVDVALHRPDMVLEARSMRGQAGEHEAAVFADARGAGEVEVRAIEAIAAAFRHRHAHELAVGVVVPAVIAADEPLGVALAFVHHLGAAMGAAIEQHVDAVVVMPRHDDGLAAEFGRDVVARVGDLAGVADVQPGAPEDALHFEFEDIRIGIDPPVNPARLDQFCYLVRMSIAHRKLRNSGRVGSLIPPPGARKPAPAR